MAELKVSAILLAAGRSLRMGGRDKLLLEYKGKTLLKRAMWLLCRLPAFEWILVTTIARLGYIDIPTKVQLALNMNHESGQSGSLRLGLNAACGEHYLFLAADQPLLTPACLLPLFELAERNPDKIVFPSVNGEPRTPSMFPSRFREELTSLYGDIGGRAVREMHPGSCITFEAEKPDAFLDIDNEEDYLALLNRNGKKDGKADRKRV